ncbi:hypothetical protein RE6C_00815 [Rhodopirellula europaea 6C]|uniref:Uncharacterized protein n=1 Tax=Rhodopirellula europaea 6C TaxID=1263867 RepID=M2B9W1_9BACT|nr:hypothetical protein RE6C_00815 [Rhodopirellula europaea 6C]
MPSELPVQRIYVGVWIACGIGLKSIHMADRHGQSSEVFHFKMLRDCHLPPGQDCLPGRRREVGGMPVDGSRRVD